MLYGNASDATDQQLIAELQNEVIDYRTNPADYCGHMVVWELLIEIKSRSQICLCYWHHWARPSELFNTIFENDGHNNLADMIAARM